MMEQHTVPVIRYGRGGLANVSMALTCQEVVSTRHDGGYMLTLRVTNIGDGPMRVRFPTAQQFDVHIAADDGTRLWSWSSNRAFMQAAHGRVLSAGESALYEVHWDGRAVDGAPCGPGRYRAVARFLGDVPGNVPAATAVFCVGPRQPSSAHESDVVVGGNS